LQIWDPPNPFSVSPRLPLWCVSPFFYGCLLRLDIRCQQLVGNLAPRITSGQVFPNNFALSNSEEIKTIYDYQNSRFLNTLYRRNSEDEKAYQMGKHRKFPILATTLDAYCQRWQIQRINFLKIDIEEKMQAAWERLAAKGKTVVAIHLRLGDYFYLSPHWIAPWEWYAEWLRGFWDTLEEPILYLASIALFPLPLPCSTDERNIFSAPISPPTS